MTSRERRILFAAAAAVAVSCLPWAIPLVWRSAIAPPETSSAARGQRLAVELGCFSCHGPGGTGGVPDPGEEDPVPAFTGGVPWNYAADVAELENWILHGDPKGRGEIQRLHGKEHHHASPPPTSEATMPASTTPSPTETAEDREEHGEHAGLLKMPPFRDHVSPQQLDDLVAYILSLSPRSPPEGEEVRRGLALARENGCFACHGPMGSGGVSNPGSFKGYIPGFFGQDLRELAKDDTEIAAWIRRGNVERLSRNPAARVFLDRQPIQMPAYEGHLEDREITDLVALVRWIQTPR